MLKNTTGLTPQIQKIIFTVQWKREVNPMLLYCWVIVRDDDPTVKQHWNHLSLNISLPSPPFAEYPCPSLLHLTPSFSPRIQPQVISAGCELTCHSEANSERHTCKFSRWSGCFQITRYSLTTADRRLAAQWSVYWLAVNYPSMSLVRPWSLEGKMLILALYRTYYTRMVLC